MLKQSTFPAIVMIGIGGLLGYAVGISHDSARVQATPTQSPARGQASVDDQGEIAVTLPAERDAGEACCSSKLNLTEQVALANHNQLVTASRRPGRNRTSSSSWATTSASGTSAPTTAA